MKKYISKLLLPACAICMSLSGSAQQTKYAKPPALKSAGYKLVWAEEFKKNGPPDPANWNYELGFERNEEYQWYQPENARCENGKLILEAKREKKSNPNFKKGSSDWKKNRQQADYTSASIKTQGLHSWMYGRFVMRGKIDIRDGIWPAWWTLGTKGSWPATGEIDMMEYYRNKLLANIAFMGADRKDAWFSTAKNIDSLGGKAWAARFHIWRMDWEENSIALYLDNKLLNKVPLDQLVNQNGTYINPFKHPHYMLLNLAIGGKQGGDPTKTTFPAKFEVDYVRVYQKKAIKK